VKDVSSASRGGRRRATSQRMKNARNQSTRPQEQRTPQADRHVFHHDGRPIRNCYTAWRSACARAGFAGRLFHDLRRTAARNYRRQGVSEGVVMKIGGWKTRSMFDRYNIQNEADLREAAAMVSQGSARNGLGKKWERIAEVRPLKASSRSSNAG
jgi:integrase